MKYVITTKQCVLSKDIEHYVEQEVSKLVRFLRRHDPILPTLDIVIRKHKKRRLNHRALADGFSDHQWTILMVHPKADSSHYYDGMMKLLLPQKPLVVHFKGKTTDEALNVGFARLMKELETYKGKHFESDSQYFDHRSIRRRVAYEE